MLRRLSPLFVTISILFLPLFFAPQTLAIDLNPLEELDNAMNADGTLEKSLQDFCEKRTGNQMNLETWYSGKCADDTFSGDAVGFSDIVFLDLGERLAGVKKPGTTFSGTLIKVLENLKSQSYSTKEEETIAINSARQELFSNQHSGLVGQTGNLIGSILQTRPASTVSYLAHVNSNLQKHKIIPDSYAAKPTATSTGIGFDTFSPFLQIWIAFRNMAYLILVIFFIVYGFMMMFRVNLGQKTVISIQLAIPKLIITLLIITFSYAIVGLIYDFMWVAIYFIFSYLGSQHLIAYRTTFLSSVWRPAYIASGNAISGIMGSFVLNAIYSGPAAIFGVLNLIFGGVGASVGLVAGYFVGISTLINIIILIAVGISYVKLLFKLVSSFISVVISLITGPLVLLGNAFPGSTAIGTWIRGIVANLSVFPVTMILLLFSYMLMVQPVLSICETGGDIVRNFFGNPQGADSFTACEVIFGVKSLVNIGEANMGGIPILAPTPLNIAPGLIGGFNARGLFALMGIGLLLMSAKYVDMVKDALKVPPFKYGTAIGEALKYGANINDIWAKNDYAGKLPRGFFGNQARQAYHSSSPGEDPTLFGRPGGTSIPKAMEKATQVTNP
jgi:hypothetical protein